MSTGERDGALPRSMRQRRVLDVAAEHPDASIEEIASRIPTATPELVDRVLGEYGDPGANETADSSDSEMSDHEPQDSADRDELTDKQREVLELVRDDPGATQRELGERLGISAAAVSNRVNDLDGFEWSDRLAFAEAVVDDDHGDADTASEPGDADAGTESDTDAATAPAEGADATASDQGGPDAVPDRDSESEASEHAGGPSTPDDLERTVDELSDRVGELSGRLDELEAIAAGEGSSGRVADGGEQRSNSADTAPFDDPELVQKVAHACLRDENITETEERRILRALLS
jgi:hypothetical protein